MKIIIMPVQAFKSPYTSELFETEEEYNLHIQEYVEGQRVDEEIQELKDQEQNILNFPRLTATSIEDFRIKYFDAVKKLNQGNDDKLLAVFFENLSFSFVSNSHSAPIGERQNFSSKDDLPKGFDGWYGEITFIYSSEINTGPDRDRLTYLTHHFPAINTASGGYTGKEYKGVKGYVLQYGLRLYIQDFPMLHSMSKEFSKLREGRFEWSEKINQLTAKRNDEDEDIKSYSYKIEKLGKAISRLEDERRKTNNLLYQRKRVNNETVLEENPFLDNEKYEILTKELRVRGYNN